MAEFDFAKSDDITLKLNSAVLGGVNKAVCTKKNSMTVIGSFLTDIPVYKITDSGYTIVLTMNFSAENPFLESNSFESIEFEGNDSTVKYSQCYVDKLETTVNAKGIIESVVTISAEERNVI